MVKIFNNPHQVFKHYQETEYYGNFVSCTNKALTLFDYEKKPDSLNTTSLELYLILVGNCAITKDSNKYYVLNGNTGVEFNTSYQPLRYIGANPYYRKQDYNLDLEKNAVLFCNSPLDRWGATGGLRWLIEHTAQMLSDNMTSLNILQKNSRVMPIITTETPNAEKAVNMILDDMYKGRPYKCISNDLINDVNVKTLLNETASGNLITKLIELRQYIKASFLNELGINSNFNMKRERLNTAEVETNDDSLFFNIENMLQARKKACEEFNAMFNENMSVKINDSWYKQNKEGELNVSNVQRENVSESKLLE